MNARQASAHLLELRQHYWPLTPKADDPEGEVNTWAIEVTSNYPLEACVAAMRSFRRSRFAPNLGEILDHLDPVKTLSPYEVITAFRQRNFDHPVVALLEERGIYDEWRFSPDTTTGGSTYEYNQFMKRLERALENATRKYESDVAVLGPRSRRVIDDGDILKGIEA